jgi:hypothetical protein
MTVWTQYAEMMQWQVATLRAFLKTKSLLYLAVLNNHHDQRTNKHLERMAHSLVVHCTVPKPIAGGPSDSHAHVLNHGLAYLRNATDFGERDILFLLDSDMFLTRPMDLLKELNGSHMWSVLQSRDNISYLWPNFSVFYFGGDEAITSGSTRFDELDFQTCQGYRGVIFDSGGCTARFLDHHRDLDVRTATTSCTSVPPTSEGEQHAVSDTCRFLTSQNAMLPTNDTRCASAHTIERAGLDAACRSDPRAAECFDHGKVYHLGSAGSNWRGCSEDWLSDRRAELCTFLRDVLSESLLGA